MIRQFSKLLINKNTSYVLNHPIYLFASRQNKGLDSHLISQEELVENYQRSLEQTGIK